jgi:hypothetical protein
LNAASLIQSLLGTGLLLLLSFTLGRRLVFALIRWTNDTFISDVPVVTAILIVMGIMALTTHLIGIHTVLGAFVAGILVGESPILTRHVDAQLRGLVVALFMPIFFSLAGLNADLSLLRQPQGARVRHERAWLHGGHRRLDWVVARCDQSGAFHHDRRHGGRNDTVHAADAAVGVIETSNP